MEKETLKLIKTIISDGILSREEEEEIIKSLNERQNRKNNKRCIVAAIEEQMEMAGLGDEKKLLCQELLRKCFKNSETGNMEASELTVTRIKEYMEDQALYLDNRTIHNFTILLQGGLKKLYKEGVLQFVPEEDMIRKFLDSKEVLNYIENPYSVEETERILEWVEEHPADIRAAAVGLVLMGGISFAEATELTTKDCWERGEGPHGVKRELGTLFYNDRRYRIVRNAVNAHPAVLGYVFAIPKSDGTGWSRMNAKGIVKKLSSICRETGVEYKKIYKNEVITIKKKDGRI